MSRVGRAIVRQVRRPGAWWASLEPQERVLHRATAALAAGLGFVWPPLVFIVPGVLWTLLFFGFSLRRST